MTPNDPSAGSARATELRRLRRPEDPFTYEVVQVGSFEDGVIGAVVQHQRAGGRALRRLPVPLAPRPAGHAGVPAAPRRASIRRRLEPGALATSLARTVKSLRPELDIYLLTDRAVEQLAGSRRGRADPAHVPQRRGADGAAPLHPRRRERPLRDAVLQQPQEVRAAPHRHVPRAAHRARQVGLPLELDPRHGPVLRDEPLPRGVLGDDRRPRQPARADRQHQARAGARRARLRRQARLLRDQRHVDVEQDRGAGGVQAGRHRHRRPQLPQVAPLRLRARRAPSRTTSRRFRSPSTRCTAPCRCARSRRRCSTARPRARSIASRPST